MIGSLSGKEDDHFVKIMIMVGKIPFGLVLDVKKPEILILDDSSSALDYATDAALRMGLRKSFPETTIFIVSQRAASILHADQILVLDDGKMVGKGTHEELLKSCEVYREIYESQFGKGGAK